MSHMNKNKCYKVQWKEGSFNLFKRTGIFRTVLKEDDVIFGPRKMLPHISTILLLLQRHILKNNKTIPLLTGINAAVIAIKSWKNVYSILKAILNIFIIFYICFTMKFYMFTH